GIDLVDAAGGYGAVRAGHRQVHQHAADLVAVVGDGGQRLVATGGHDGVVAEGAQGKRSELADGGIVVGEQDGATALIGGRRASRGSRKRSHGAPFVVRKTPHAGREICPAG